MKEWEKKSNKSIEKEFERLLWSIGNCNGVNDLIDVVNGIPNIKQKKDFVVSWHEYSL